MDEKKINNEEFLKDIEKAAERGAKKGNLKYAMIYTVVVHNIIMLFFSNMFLYLPVVSQFIYIPLIFAKRKRVDLKERKK